MRPPTLSAARQVPYPIEIDPDKLGAWLEGARAAQSVGRAVVGGLFAAIVGGGVLLSGFSASSGLRLEAVPLLGMGLWVGCCVRYFGQGIDRCFGVLGALFALLGSLGTKTFSFALSMQWQLQGGPLRGGFWRLLAADTDVLEIGALVLVLAEGYYLSFKRITQAELASLAAAEPAGVDALGPGGVSRRKPLACPEGHRWDPVRDQPLPAGGGRVVCPRCGGVLTAWVSPGRFEVTPDFLRRYGPHTIAALLFAGSLGTVCMILLHQRRPAIFSVAFGSDGGTLAVAHSSADFYARCEVRVWDLRARRPRWQFPHRMQVRAVALSPDGHWLAAGTCKSPEDQSGLVVVRHLPTGKEDRLGGHRRRVVALVFVPNTRTLVSAGEDGTVKAWDVPAGRELVSFDHGAWIGALAVAPDGRSAATGDWYGTVKLWDLAAGRERLVLSAHRGRVSSVCFSPDGRTLATAGGIDPTVKLWDAAGGGLRATWSPPADWLTALAFAPDGKTLAVGGGYLRRPGAVLLCETATGRVERTFPVRTNAVLSLAFAPDGKTLAAGSGQAIRLLTLEGGGSVCRWEVRTGRELEALE